MPGAGKSTIGVQLAKALALDFVDTDLLIQTQQGCPLQEILGNKGYLALRAIEAQVILDLNSKNTLISTGGSAVYSDAAMRHLKTLGTIVFLAVSLDTLKQRVDNEASRGIARPEGQTFDAVYTERTPLYQQYADITYDNNQYRGIEELRQQIEQYHSRHLSNEPL
jgi:shikimate kinase